MCVSNRIEQFSASYFLTGHLLFTVLLAQVAHEQGVGDDGSRDGDDHSDNTAHHIGHADVVQDAVVTMAIIPGALRRAPPAIARSPTPLTSFQKVSSKQRATSSPFW